MKAKIDYSWALFALMFGGIVAMCLVTWLQGICEDWLRAIISFGSFIIVSFAMYITCVGIKDNKG
jgi:hypothetical protein